MESQSEQIVRPVGARRADQEAAAGARLLRAFFGAWKTLALRGARDPGFQTALAELHLAVDDTWSAGEPAHLLRYGRALMVGREPIGPRSLLRLQAEVLADELLTRNLGGIGFRQPWDDGEVTRFLGLLHGWRRSDGNETREAKQQELAAQSISCVTLEEEITGNQVNEERSAWDGVPQLGEARQRAKRTFFHALRAARVHVRSMAGNSQPQTRRARAVVHEIVDRLLEEEYAILSMTALNDFDAYTFHHCVNVCILATALGQRLGLNKREVSELGVSAMFHDLGKLSVPEPVLNKPGKFDPHEWELIKRHPLEGVRATLHFEKMNDLVLKIMLVALEHHMRVDLTGYPRLDDRWDVSILSRIVSIADCYDAMTTKRVYHERAMHPHDVLRHMLALSGENFDERLLRLFVNMMGFFPVGSLVKLSSGELAIAVSAQERRPTAPVVRIVRDAGGRNIDPLDLQLVNLADEHVRGGRRIAEPADIQDAGIDLASYLL